MRGAAYSKLAWGRRISHAVTELNLGVHNERQNAAKAQRTLHHLLHVSPAKHFQRF